jgi:excisionase family DNA binding protein
MTSREQAREPMLQKQVFTTGEAAELCNVSQQTIIRCFDKGRLNGFRVPGSRFRRIPREDLITFMKCNGMPVDALCKSAQTLLLVELNSQRVDQVSSALGTGNAVELEVATDAFDAGTFMERCQPDLVVIGSGLHGVDPVTVRRRLDESSRNRARVMVFLGDNENGLADRLSAQGIDSCVRGDVDALLILDELRDLHGS